MAPAGALFANGRQTLQESARSRGGRVLVDAVGGDLQAYVHAGDPGGHVGVVDAAASQSPEHRSAKAPAR